MAQSQDDRDRHTDNALTEESPLLRGLRDDRFADEPPRTRPNVNKGSWRRMAGVFLLMTISYVVIGSIISYKRLSLPSPKSVADATGPSDFSAQWAWQHLEQIAQKPHPLNSRENLRIHNYLLQTVKDLQKEASLRNLTVEIGNDDVKLTMANNFLSNATRIEFYESSNILVRVVGTEGKSEDNLRGHAEAVVVDAHYGKSKEK